MRLKFHPEEVADKTIIESKDETHHIILLSPVSMHLHLLKNILHDGNHLKCLLDTQNPRDTFVEGFARVLAEMTITQNIFPL